MEKIDLCILDSSALAEEGAVCTLRHPVSRVKLDITIVLVGMDSARYRRAESQLVEKYRRNKGEVRTPEEIREDVAATLAACTLDWSNVTVDGVDMPCTRENAKGLYLRFPWIQEQVSGFVSDRGNYLKDLPTACAPQ